MFHAHPPLAAGAAASIPSEWDAPETTLLKLAAIIAILLLNAFFVACRFAIAGLSSSRVEALAEQGNRRARFAARIADAPERYLAAAQAGNCLSSVAIGILAIPLLAGLLAPLFHHSGMAAGTTIHAASTVLAFGLIVFPLLILAELAPGALAARKSLPLALWIARPLHAFHLLLRPLVRPAEACVNTLLRSVFKLESATHEQPPGGDETLRDILEDNENSATVTPLGRELLINALELRHRVARDIMTPRGEVVFLDPDELFQNQVEQAIASRHTRFPLARGHLDDAIGLVHIKDLLALVRDNGSNLSGIRRELTHVPESMPLEKLLHFFLGKQAHLALVVDEYGGAVGIVTLDNVLEELVGSIQDEFDDPAEEVEVRKISEQEFDVEGGMALYELEDMLGVDLDAGEISTIGGYVTAELGHIPRQGEQAAIGPYTATVTSSDGRRVLRVHLRRLPVSSADARSAAPLISPDDA